MGTSTVHRSPGTQRWRIVNSLYNDPKVPLERVLVEVFNAAENYPTGLADGAVLTRIQVLLQIAGTDRWPRGAQAALATARDTIREAQTTAWRSGQTSYYGDLADRAIHATFITAARHPDIIATTRDVLKTFLSCIVSVAIDHVVSRDLTSHLGKGRLSGVTEALALRDELVSRARAVASDERLGSALDDAVRSPQNHWASVIGKAWEIGGTLPR